MIRNYRVLLFLFVGAVLLACYSNRIYRTVAVNLDLHTPILSVFTGSTPKAPKVCQDSYDLAATFYKPDRLIIDFELDTNEGLSPSFPSSLKETPLVQQVKSLAENNFSDCLRAKKDRVVLQLERSSKGLDRSFFKEENLILHLSINYKHNAPAYSGGTLSCKFFRPGLPARLTYINFFWRGGELRLAQNDDVSNEDFEQEVEKKLSSFLEKCIQPEDFRYLPQNMQDQVDRLFRK